MQILCREVLKARIHEAKIILERARGNHDNQYDVKSGVLIQREMSSGL